MKFRYMDTSSMWTAVIGLMVMLVGISVVLPVFDTFFTPTPTNKTIESKTKNQTGESLLNVSTNMNSIFNLVGIVLIIGTIMSIVAVVFSFLGHNRYSDFDDGELKRKDPGMPYSEALKKQAEEKPEPPKNEKHDSFASWKKHHGK